MAENTAPAASFDDLLARHGESAPAGSFDDLLSRYAPPSPRMGSTGSDVIDGFLANTAVGRVLDAFGHGAKEGWGAGAAGIEPGGETEQFLKGAGILPDYQKGQTGLVRSFNEALIRPAATALDATMRGVSALVTGGAAAVGQTVDETGLSTVVGMPGSSLARDIVGLTIHESTSPVRVAPPRVDLNEARDLGVIGKGEAGWKGTAEERATLDEARRRLEPSQDPLAAVVKDERAVTDESAPSGAAPAEVPTPGTPPADVSAPDINTLARQVAPDIFRQYDALAQRKETFRRWIDELSDIRRQNAERDAPHAEEIADLQRRLEDATPRLAKKYQARLDELLPEHDAFIADAVSRDTPDMARVRKALMDDDFRMRDLAPDVSAAYRTARERLGPEAEAAQEAPAVAAAAPEAESATPAAVAGEEAVPPPAEAPGETPATEPARPAPAEAAPTAATPANQNRVTDIAGDVAKKLVAVGRPVEEANAAAAIVQAHYEARAARFGGKKGSAADLYAAEAPQIRAGRSRPAKASAREREFAQASIGFEDAKRAAANDDAIRSAFDKMRDSVARGLAKAEKHEALFPTAVKKFREMLAYLDDVGPDGFVRSKFDKMAAELDRIMSGGGDNVTTLRQGARGKITLRDGRAIITLFKDADASTFMHETGHAWLEELIRDAKDKDAPADLLKDAQTVRDWLGAKDGEAISTKQHEKFARGFERYLMEGVAPTRALAGIFAKFKAWLTTIYETVQKLRAPISDDIRDVFDRLITANPEREAVVASEREPAKAFADIHEKDAEATPPELAHEVANAVRGEIERLALEKGKPPHDKLNPGGSGDAGGGIGGVSPPDAGHPSGADAAGPDAGRPGVPAEPGAVAAGGNEAPAEGAGVRETDGGGAARAEHDTARRAAAVGRTEEPASPNEPFGRSDNPLVDKAGNIRLDNLGTPEDVNAAIRQAAAENDDFFGARRGVVADAQVLDLADALGMDPSALSARKIGEAFNAEQIVAARKLLIRSATFVRDAMAKAAQGSDADVMAYAEAKARHAMIQEQVAGITAEAGRALRAFRALDGAEEAAALGKFLEDNTGKTLFQLRQEAQLGLKLDTPQKVSKFVRDTQKPTFKDMVVEAWISALLSGPRTHLANLMGNAIVALWRPVETATAGTIGTVRRAITGSNEGVRIGEAAAELHGIVQGAQEGVVAAWTAFKTEEPQFTGTRQIEAHPKAIPGMAGQVIRAPLRALTAEDEFFKAIAFRAEINRAAYTQAAGEGLTGERLAARAAELAQSPTEAMIAGAKKAAEYQTFQNPLGPTGRAVQQFSNSHILAKLVVPFVRTPINLLKYAAERTPLGLFSEEVRANLSGRNGAAARDTQAARIALGTAIGVSAFALAAQGLITGGGPADPKKRALLRADGWQPYSVRVGEFWYSFDRFDPFSVILGLAADAHEIAAAAGSAHPDAERVPALIFASIVKNVVNRASLKGPSDLIQAVSDPDRYGPAYLRGLVGTVVPGGMAQTAQAMDPVVRETRTVLDGIRARVPGLSTELMAKRDVWGEPVVRDGSLGPDFGSPIYESRLRNDPVNQALLRLGVYPAKPERKIRGVELTDRQYDDFQRVAGRMGKRRANAIVAMPGFSAMPESVQRDLLTNAIKSSRETARALVMMENPSLIERAVAAKKALVTDGPAAAKAAAKLP